MVRDAARCHAQPVTRARISITAACDALLARDAEAGCSLPSNSKHALRLPCPPADLKTLDGLDPLVALLSEDNSPEVQAAAAYVIGTAGSNNDKFQEQLMGAHPGVLARLLQVGGGRGALTLRPDRAAAAVLAAGCTRAARVSSSRAVAQLRVVGPASICMHSWAQCPEHGGQQLLLNQHTCVLFSNTIRCKQR
jgi:hypothetical protein